MALFDMSKGIPNSLYLNPCRGKKVNVWVYTCVPILLYLVLDDESSLDFIR